jgi:hypothetical protein
MSKIAPLESWGFAASTADLDRSDYSSDTSFQNSGRDISTFPRFCFRFFRPTPLVFAAFLRAIDSQPGPVYWQLTGDCLAAYPQKLTFMAPINTDEDMQTVLKKFEELQRNPPKANPEFVGKAIADIPRFCGYVEDRLGLKNKDPQQFDPQWLTKEGLSQHPGEDEDFWDPGSWSVILTCDPETRVKPGPTPPSLLQQLSFGISSQETSVVLEELGVNWDVYGQTQSMGKVSSEYPQISKLIDDMNDVVYSPDEAEALLAECLRAREVVKRPESIRGLDKLTRIARGAKRSKLGIRFVGED